MQQKCIQKCIWLKKANADRKEHNKWVGGHTKVKGPNHVRKTLNPDPIRIN